jgi:SAM-dependent methyltransferase
MLARVTLPSEHIAWNQYWHAPFGRMRHAHVSKLPVPLRARICGPFAFQPNSATRTAEYPWAYHAAPLSRGDAALEIGGGLSGFQFVLAKGGARVTNVDPLVDYGFGDYERADILHHRINRALGTNVRLVPATLDKAGLDAGSIDVAYCISTIEHLDEAARQIVLDETRRVLKPGGRLVLTIDLFLNLKPFTSRTSNQFGVNVSIGELVGRSGMTLIEGSPAELYGYSEFRADAVLSSLEQYFIGTYPALSQMLVLRR